MGLKCKLQSSIADPVVRQRMGGLTVAEVLTADEQSNRCKVKVLDSNGVAKTIDNVMVDLRNGQEWFPHGRKKENAGVEEHGDFVLFDMAGTGMIVSMYTEDYNGEVRGLKTLDNDRMADGESSMVGGTII